MRLTSPVNSKLPTGVSILTITRGGSASVISIVISSRDHIYANRV
jgi:hypothetical protein